MISAEELATKLDGCENIDYNLIKEAGLNNLVIVYGYSDDNIEIRGTIDEEIGAFNGGTAYFFNQVLVLECDNPCDHCEERDRRDIAKRVEAHWDKDGYSWVMEALDGLKAYSFDMLEDGEKFCKGLVFDLTQT